MRFNQAALSSLAAFSLAPQAFAFPSADNFAQLARRGVAGSADASPEDLHRDLVRLREKRLLFDPLTDPIDVAGAHAFQAPDLDGGDQRGPCPGLNALANHGYISRDGVVSMVEVIAAVNTVYGMGIDLITVLAVMGTAFTGNPLSLNPGFSLGGPSSKSNNILGNLGGLLGTPRGLAGSHNLIEADSSGTRDDLYVTGNAHTMNMTLFEMALDSAEDGVLTMDLFAKRAADRFDESISINPYFYYGPYTGLVARNAGYLFNARLLSNHSVEYPLGGHMTTEVLKSFFAVYEEDGEMVYKEGHEQIPANWYRISADYGLLSLNLDLVDWVAKYPKLGSIGGNTGTVNSFAGVDLEDLTGGVLNVATLLQDNNLICFALEVVKTFAPNSLSTLFKALETPLSLINDAIADPILDLACPVFDDLKMDGTDLWDGLLGRYPGAEKSGAAL
ncbi:Chloroperoxidase [Xylariaceae sp. FL0016]|nr:Chloroperoxidase [Xylariaceae sp. FL0016]